jgi:hypothetical protein
LVVLVAGCTCNQRQPATSTANQQQAQPTSHQRQLPAAVAPTTT